MEGVHPCAQLGLYCIHHISTLSQVQDMMEERTGADNKLTADVELQQFKPGTRKSETGSKSGQLSAQ
jgi:hypothetical protein